MNKISKWILQSIFLTVFFGGMSYSVYAYSPSFHLKKETFTYELGTPISEKPENFVHYNIYKEGVRTILPKEMNKIGTYEAKIIYRSFQYPFKIKIKDTTKPKFKEIPKEIQLFEGSSKKNLPKFKAHDLSEVTITIDDSKVNYDQAGQYKLNVSAQDTSKNTQTISIPVFIQKKVTEKPFKAKLNKNVEFKENRNPSKEEKGMTENLAGESIQSIKPAPSSEEETKPKPAPAPVEPSVENVNYNAIRIPNVTNLAAVSIGSSQEAVDTYDICLMSDIGSVPGSGQPILIGGHNYRTLGSLPSVPVGGVITLKYNGSLYNYRITTSAECKTSGSDMTSTTTGENLLEIGTGRDMLQIYTCYYTGNFRWFVKAERI